LARPFSAFLRSAALRSAFLPACLCAFLLSCQTQPESCAWRDVSASLSPDGALAASLDLREPGVDSLSLHVLRLDGSAPPKPLASGAHPALTPAFSPDSSRVLYLKEGVFHMSLMVAPLSGEEPSELASFRVSPKHISCQRSASRILVLCFMEGYFGVSSSMHVYELSSGALRDIELPVSDVESFAISASGSTAAFSDGRRVWIQDLDDPGASPREVSALIPGLDRPLWLALSPDGSALCLRTGRLERKNVNSTDDKFTLTDLGRIAFRTVDSRALRLVDLKGGSEPQTVLAGAAASNVSFSPDSKRLLYVQGTGVFVYDLASKSRLAIPCPRYEYGRFVEWFGDSRIVYRDNLAKGMDARLWVVDAQGSSAPKELWALGGGKPE